MTWLRSPLRGSTAKKAAWLVGGLCLLQTVVSLVHGHFGYLSRLDTRRTLYRPRRRCAATTQSLPGARRVWVLMIDGLRADVARTLPHLSALMRAGARRTLLADFPSFTFPQLATMMTGVVPFLSGVRTNDGQRRVELETLLGAAARSDRTVTLVNEGDWSELDQAIDPRLAAAAEHVTLAAL